MGIDSGTTNIFDEVDKSDFKTDFGSEFPVGSTFEFLSTISPLFPPSPPCLHPAPCPLFWNDLCTCDVNVVLPSSSLGHNRLVQLSHFSSSSVGAVLPPL